MKRISFIFSFRNEEDNIPELVKRVDNLMSKINGYDYEMIFVNDCSTDNSYELLMRLKESFPIKILTTSRRFGVTPCVLAGMKLASGDAVIYMDADLQDPPELCEKLIAEYELGYDVVHTRRTQRLGEGRIKLFATKIAYKIINLYSDIHLPENVGDFKLISRRALKEILSMKEYDPYMRGVAIWVGFRQTYVDYVRDPRFNGETKFPLLSKGPRREFLRGVTAFSSGPLYLAFTLALLAIGFSFCVIIYAILSKFFNIAAPGSSGLLVVIGILFSMVLFTNGIIGVYVAKIYDQAKDRPRVIVDSIK